MATNQRAKRAKQLSPRGGVQAAEGATPQPRPAQPVGATTKSDAFDIGAFDAWLAKARHTKREHLNADAQHVLIEEYKSGRSYERTLADDDEVLGVEAAEFDEEIQMPAHGSSSEHRGHRSVKAPYRARALASAHDAQVPDASRDDDAAGLLMAEPSNLTREAVAIVPSDQLYELLCLDGDDASAVRTYLNAKRVALGREASKRDAIAKLASRMTNELRGSWASDPTLWRAALKMSLPVVERFLMAIKGAAEGAANASRAQTRNIGRRSPRHDAKGTRSATSRIRRRVALLRSELGWTVPGIAKLIIASASDWSDPPCPELARRYMNREGELKAWLDTHLARARDGAD